MQKYIFYINGEWCTSNTAKIPFNDASFLLGDGIFETIRFDNNILFKQKEHLNRLFASLKLIHINLQISINQLESLLYEIIDKNILTSGLLRLMITRGNIEGEPWKYKGPANIYISIRPLSPLPNTPVKVVYFSENNYPIIRYNAAIKSMNYIGNMLAKKDAEKYNAFEPVFYNKEGFITECAIRNIFFIKENCILTPNKNLGVLPGVMRNTIIHIAKNLNLEVRETEISKKSINDMDEAFISSTGIGLLPCFWEDWESNYMNTNKIKTKLTKLMNM